MHFQIATLVGTLQMCQMKKWLFTVELERITTSMQRQKTATLDGYFTVLIHFASFDVKPICRDPHGPSVISIN